MKKRKTPGTLFLLLFMILLMGCGSEETGPQFGSDSHPPEYWPTDDWRSIDPAEVGMDAVELQQVYDYVANPNINAQGFVLETAELSEDVLAAYGLFAGDTVESSDHLPVVADIVIVTEP